MGDEELSDEELDQMSTEQLKHLLLSAEDRFAAALGRQRGMEWAHNILTLEQKLALRAAVHSSGDGADPGDASHYVTTANEQRHGLFDALTDDLGRWWPDQWSIRHALERYVEPFRFDDPDNPDEPEEYDSTCTFTNEVFAIHFIRGALEQIDRAHPS